MNVITSERIPIKIWTDLDTVEDNALQQLKNCASLPFAFKHIAAMPDVHQGYGITIGGVLATEDVIIPNAIGVDIGCGVRASRTNIKIDDLEKDVLKKIMGEIRKAIPVGFNKHTEMQDLKYMPYGGGTESTIGHSYGYIIDREYNNARKSLGSLGGGNHFIEIQKGDDGFVWIMLHSGSRNLGKQVADHYNKIAVKLNEKWHSSVPKEYQLAFLPLDSQEGMEYRSEMEYALEFAKCNRYLMMDRITEIFYNNFSELINFDNIIDVHHNYATMENHFGKNVMVHRKGAISAKEGELGIIPGSQGSKSYIVKGKENRESFMSCSHGAGRQMGRKEAQRTLNLKDEIKLLDEQGIIHGIRHQNDLDEATGSYKDIDVVMANQKDLVEIVVRLQPLAVIKG